MTEKEAYICFSCFPEIGPVRFSLLLKHFGSAKRAWNAPEFSAARQIFDLPSYLKKLKEQKIRVITLKDKEYPKRLKEIQDPPFLLYAKGRGELARIAQVAVAIVGTRSMTSYGKRVTERLTRGLVDAGVTVVSGLAQGIDSVAHETAVARGGKTVAVLGHGLDQVYPPKNKKLATWIVEKHRGLLVSEYPLGFALAASNFPRRNRIVSGLSLGIVVVEGAQKSGSLITASAAAAQGRDVFAVPGPVTSPMSAAPHFLLKNGAKLVENAGDILEELDLTRDTIIKK